MSIVYGEERELFQDENYPNIDDHITHDSHHQQHHSQTTHDTQQQELEHPLHDPHPQAHDTHHPHDSNNHQELTEQHHGSPSDTDRFTNANDVVVSDLSNDLVEVARATCNAHAAAAAAGAAFGAVQTDPRLNDYLAASPPETEPQPAPVSAVDVPVTSSLAVQASLPIQLTPPLEQQQQQQQQQSRVVHPLLPPQLVAQITQPLSPAAPSPPSHPQQEQQSPSTPAPSGRIKPIPKPVRQATKNAEGKFVCMWPGCAEDIKEFGRKCEWNKHMDKHDRPYKCGAVGCEKLPGFTYSGGLLRHEREVHGKHGGPKNPLHCPHESCKRATGKGFSRLENLNEHLRRVHTHSADGTTTTTIGMLISNGNSGSGINANVGADESDEATSDETSFGGQPHPQPQAAPQSHSHHLLLKRKRRHRDYDDNFGGGIGGGLGGETSELREEVKRLRQENEELREQVQKNTQQTTLLVQKLQALTEAMAPRANNHNNHHHQNNHNNNNMTTPPPTGQMATTTTTTTTTAVGATAVGAAVASSY